MTDEANACGCNRAKERNQAAPGSSFCRTTTPYTHTPATKPTVPACDRQGAHGQWCREETTHLCIGVGCTRKGDAGTMVAGATNYTGSGTMEPKPKNKNKDKNKNKQAACVARE